jgi:integrase
MSKRRGNNEGSVYQRSDGLWCGKASVGRDENGKARRRPVYGKTRAEAVSKMNKLIADHQKGVESKTPDKTTVAQRAEKWLRETVAHMDQPNTLSYYTYSMKHHVIPAIGSVKLVELKPSHVHDMINAIRGKTSQRGTPFARKTIKAAHEAISAMLSEALRENLVERNVAMAVRTNDGREAREKQSKFVVMTPSESVRLIDAAADHEWKNFILASMNLGIRRAELLALRWQDIDFETGWISVWNSIQMVRVKLLKKQPEKRFSGAGSRMTSLKTGSSQRRDIEMSQQLRVIFMEQKEQQQKQREKADDKWVEQDFVFTNRFGNHWHPDYPSSIFRKICASAELPPEIHLHSLRHNFASAQLRAGTHAKLVQQQLGHSRIGTTLDKYSHLVPGERTRMPSVMADYLDEGRKMLTLEREKAAAVAALAAERASRDRDLISRKSKTVTKTVTTHVFEMPRKKA